MTNERQSLIERHIKTHSIRSDEDRSAVSVLESFLRSGGKVNTNFSCNDKWPNTDGTFEYVINPETSRRPNQNFFVQIKGTHVYEEVDGGIKYSLQSLAFPAFISMDVTLDPGILFVVLNPDCRGKERVFWKYMSVSFLNSINFENESVTIRFAADEEILYTDESVEQFCKEIEKIVYHHSFVNKLDSTVFTRKPILNIIRACNEEITECIDRLEIYNDTRDNVSRRMLLRLYDLCKSVMLLNALDMEENGVNLQLAWEYSIMDIETKYLGKFLKGLQYVSNRVPDEGQSERLMLKYYNFLWQIRKFMYEKYKISILGNLERFPVIVDELDHQFYELASKAVDEVGKGKEDFCVTKFYVQKKTPFYVGTERYYEITLQMAGLYATKYNRITVYTKENISTNYSVQVSYTDVKINLWDVESNIKVVTKWRVSIDTTCLNKFAKILNINTKVSSKYGEYIILMDFLTKTGINLLELIDLQEIAFNEIVDSIYKEANTAFYKEVLIKLRKQYSLNSKSRGRNVIRYLLLNLREETIEDVMASGSDEELLCEELLLSKSCYPFEKNPFLSNLLGSKTSEENHWKRIIDAVGNEMYKNVQPYVRIKGEINRTGEIYFEVDPARWRDAVKNYNRRLDAWERGQGYEINLEDNLVYINSYEQSTLDILNRLLEYAQKGNKGQKEFNNAFLKQSNIVFSDPIKEQTLKTVFVNSHILMIYGAAGTGKTTLINYISNLTGGRSKLFLTNTHTALENMKRRIDYPGPFSEFSSMSSFLKKKSTQEYDIIFMDECSTIDNRSMQMFLNKINKNVLMVLAGDIHQIESIDFGNWFFYAKDIITFPGSNVELLNTWRTEEQNLIKLWNEVRCKGELITEMLVIDGPFSEEISPNIFEQEYDDEVVLCLNYDGKFGLNNMNTYFQNANSEGELVSWQEWNYKIGDHILFNETKRFPILHNNLKGKIVAIEKVKGKITFTIDAYISLTENDCRKHDIEFVDVLEGATRIRFDVYDYDENPAEEDMRMNFVIPFQLAYAVSIHKAQGLEYDSVKVIIPSSNAERITHGIFYTAITRAKKKLKIYWSSETMHKIVSKFSTDDEYSRSLEVIKKKLVNTSDTL